MKPLLDLERGECRWPVSDKPFLFCAEPAVDGSSYCACHRERSVSPEQPAPYSGRTIDFLAGGRARRTPQPSGERRPVDVAMRTHSYAGPAAWGLT